MELTPFQYATVKANPNIIDNLIKERLGFTRWEDNPYKVGYSGFILTQNTTNSPATLELVWTLDGVSSKLINLTSIQRRQIIEVIEDYADY